MRFISVISFVLLAHLALIQATEDSDTEKIIELVTQEDEGSGQKFFAIDEEAPVTHLRIETAEKEDVTEAQKEKNFYVLAQEVPVVEKIEIIEYPVPVETIEDEYDEQDGYKLSSNETTRQYEDKEGRVLPTDQYEPVYQTSEEPTTTNTVFPVVPTDIMEPAHYTSEEPITTSTVFPGVVLPTDKEPVTVDFKISSETTGLLGDAPPNFSEIVEMINIVSAKKKDAQNFTEAIHHVTFKCPNVEKASEWPQFAFRLLMITIPSYERKHGSQDFETMIRRNLVTVLDNDMNREENTTTAYVSYLGCRAMKKLSCKFVAEVTLRRTTETGESAEVLPKIEEIELSNLNSKEVCPEDWDKNVHYNIDHLTRDYRLRHYHLEMKVMQEMKLNFIRDSNNTISYNN